ncbi:hypothetical protein ACFLT1_08620, partial [Bacteroidota bacterium]
DQLHPSGEMDMETYNNIGYAFDYVEKIEAYGIGGKHIARTGVYTSENKASTEGTVQMLLEQQVNFNVVNTLEDWSDIEVLIITSGGILEEDISRLTSFLERGGKLIVMGNGIFCNNKQVINIGAEYLGKANYDVDYTIVGDEIATDLVRTPFLNYRPAMRVAPDAGTEVLASIREPYFSRTLAHYCSHKNTPYTLEDAAHPSAIRKGNIVFLAHDLDRQYYQEGARVHRDLFINALNLLRTNPMAEVEMPSSGRINLLRQDFKHRYVLHMLYATPIQRGSVRVIEDLVPLYNVPVTIDLEEQIKKAYMIPSGKRLRMKVSDGKIHLTIPEFTCHTGVVLEY